MARRPTGSARFTIPERIRDKLDLQPGAAVEFSVNATGGVVLSPARPARTGGPRKDRLDAARDRADVRWRTDELMTLLRGDWCKCCRTIREGSMARVVR